MKYATVRQWWRKSERRHLVAAHRKEDRKRYRRVLRLVLNYVRKER